MVQVKHVDLVAGLTLPVTKIRNVEVMTNGTIRLFYECDVPPEEEPAAEKQDTKRTDPAEVSKQVEAKREHIKEKIGGAKEK